MEKTYYVEFCEDSEDQTKGTGFVAEFIGVPTWAQLEAAVFEETLYRIELSKGVELRNQYEAVPTFTAVIYPRDNQGRVITTRKGQQWLKLWNSGFIQMEDETHFRLYVHFIKNKEETPEQDPSASALSILKCYFAKK